MGEGGRGEREEAAVELSYGLSQCVLPKLISGEKTVNPKPYLHCGIHKVDISECYFHMCCDDIFAHSMSRLGEKS